MEELRQALKSYRQMASDMAEFADEGHLERNDKLATIIKLQHGALAVSLAAQKVVCDLKQMDKFVFGDFKLICEACTTIKDMAEKLADTCDQQKMSRLYGAIMRMFERILIFICEREADSESDRNFRRGINAVYFRNEIA